MFEHFFFFSCSDAAGSSGLQKSARKHSSVNERLRITDSGMF